MYKRVSLLHCFRFVRHKEIGLNFFNSLLKETWWGMCGPLYNGPKRPSFFHFSFFCYLFILIILLLFNYSCLPFLPIPPLHPSWTFFFIFQYFISVLFYSKNYTFPLLLFYEDNDWLHVSIFTISLLIMEKRSKKNLSSKRPSCHGQFFIFLSFYTNVLHMSFSKLLVHQTIFSRFICIDAYGYSSLIYVSYSNPLFKCYYI